jgi:hypothetical protein
MHHVYDPLLTTEGFRTATEQDAFIARVKRVGHVRRTFNLKTGEVREAQTEAVEPETRKDGLRERLIARLLR